jgi:hypothetical protein
MMLWTPQKEAEWLERQRDADEYVRRVLECRFYRHWWPCNCPRRTLPPTWLCCPTCGAKRPRVVFLPPPPGKPEPPLDSGAGAG